VVRVDLERKVSGCVAMFMDEVLRRGARSGCRAQEVSRRQAFRCRRKAYQEAGRLCGEASTVAPSVAEALEESQPGGLDQRKAGGLG
jgi:hypothetical protein